jgi:glycosyltransferase involved in cell wall biosynthesis
MNSKLKVVWIVYGENRIYIDIARILGKSCDLTLIMRARHRTDSFPRDNYKQAYLPVIEKSFKILFLPILIKNLFSKDKIELSPVIYFRDLSNTLKRIKPDVIISNICYMPATWQAASYCKTNKVPFIIQTEMQRFPNYPIAKEFAKYVIAKGFIFKEAKLILPWTYNSLIFAKENFSKEDNKKVKLLTPGIDSKKFHKIPFKKDTKIVNIVQVSRMIPYKNHKDLINAVNILKNKHSLKIHLTLLGKGYYRTELEKLVANLGMSKSVEFIDKIESEQMYKIYSKQDILVLPSYNEAIGMVVPEAMACGVPTIVSDTCGAKTYVREGVDGYVFKTGDINDLVKKILLLAKDRKKCSEFGLRAEKSIKTNYTNQIIAKKLYKFIVEAKNKN